MWTSRKIEDRWIEYVEYLKYSEQLKQVEFKVYERKSEFYKKTITAT